MLAAIVYLTAAGQRDRRKHEAFLAVVVLLVKPLADLAFQASLRHGVELRLKVRGGHLLSVAT